MFKNSSKRNRWYVKFNLRNIKRKEHVVYAKHNDSWIIIKTVMRNPIGNKFYLIKKDFKVNETPKVIQSKYTKIFKDSISAAEYMLEHKMSAP